MGEIIFDSDLDLLEGSNIDRLDVVFKLHDALLQEVCGHFVIFHNTADLQLLDTKCQRYQLGSSPQKTITLDGPRRKRQK